MNNSTPLKTENFSIPLCIIKQYIRLYVPYSRQNSWTKTFVYMFPIAGKTARPRHSYICSDFFVELMGKLGVTFFQHFRPNLNFDEIKFSPRAFVVL